MGFFSRIFGFGGVATEETIGPEADPVAPENHWIRKVSVTTGEIVITNKPTVPIDPREPIPHYDPRKVKTYRGREAMEKFPYFSKLLVQPDQGSALDNTIKKNKRDGLLDILVFFNADGVFTVYNPNAYNSLVDKVGDKVAFERSIYAGPGAVDLAFYDLPTVDLNHNMRSKGDPEKTAAAAAMERQSVYEVLQLDKMKLYKARFEAGGTGEIRVGAIKKAKGAPAAVQRDEDEPVSRRAQSAPANLDRPAPRPIRPPAEAEGTHVNRTQAPGRRTGDRGPAG